MPDFTLPSGDGATIRIRVVNKANQPLDVADEEVDYFWEFSDSRNGEPIVTKARGDGIEPSSGYTDRIDIDIADDEIVVRPGLYYHKTRVTINGKTKTIRHGQVLVPV